MPEGHAVNGTLISTYAVEAGYELGPHDNLAGDLVLPGMSGLISSPGSLKGRDYTLFLTILGREASGVYTRARYLQNLQSLASLIVNPNASGVPQAFTLTRTLNLPSGDQVCTINARYLDGFRVAQASWSAGRASVVLRLLDGWWLNGAVKVYS